MEAIEKKYPKGTTKEQWDAYEERCEEHNQFISQYRSYLGRIVNHLQWINDKSNNPGESYTPEEINRIMSNEIDMMSSMNAPNKPGYYRANND